MQKENTSHDRILGEDCPDKTGYKENSSDEEVRISFTSIDELSSDGSASAFEGTESIDSHEQDMNFKRKAEQLKNDPSGRSNY
jgi:hypothetical protein